jgi:hypothetical protein
MASSSRIELLPAGRVLVFYSATCPATSKPDAALLLFA